MRPTTFGIGLALVLAAGMAHTQAQAPKQKTPPRAAEQSRFAPDLIELLLAMSNGYELNGKAVAPAMDITGILKAAQSQDPKVRELGRLYCDLVYLYAKLRKQQPDPEIERLARASMPDVKAECLRIVLTRVKPEELVTFGISAAFIEKLVKEGRKEGVFAKSDTNTQVLEDLVFNEPLEQSVQSATLLVVGQTKGLAAKEKVQALVGKPIGSAASVKEPLKVKLETTNNNQVVVAVTNQSKTPLHHCLLLARAIPNPALVERKINSDKVLLLLGAGALGASDKFTEKTLDYILLQSVLYNMERGGLVFVPEIPAGGTVRLGLTSSEDMVYLKDSELSLWCDELTVTGLKTGTRAGIHPRLAGEPFPPFKDKNFASVKAELTKSDPRDPNATPGRGTLCKVYKLAMTTKQTYLIETTVARTTQGLNTPPTLRVEDEDGEVQTTRREQSQTGSVRIAFTPPVDGTYRIVCTEPMIGGPGKFTLTVFKKGTTNAAKDEAKDALTVTVDDVDYVYQGTTRNGAQMFVTVLAKSKQGEKRVPLGRMVLVDEEGNQYQGMPIGGLTAPQVLRQSVPLKLVWRFGPNPNNAFETKARPAPSAKIKRFASVSIETVPAAVEFRDVPAVVSKTRPK